MASMSSEFREYEQSEPLLKENPRRWVMFPVEYPTIYDMYKKHTAAFWTAEDVDLAQDMKDWEALGEDEKRFVKEGLAHLLTFDTGALADLATRISTEVQSPEARGFYGFQITMEAIHAEAHARLFSQIVKDKEERARLFAAARASPAAEARGSWAAEAFDAGRSFTERLVAFAFAQVVLRSGAYCAIFRLKDRELMPGLAFANERVARDKCMHADFAALLYSMLGHRLPEDAAQRIARGAVEAERRLICEALPSDLVGAGREEMGAYVEFVADRLLVALGHEKAFGVSCPFQWASMAELPDREHFAEKQEGGDRAASKTPAGGEAKEEVFAMDQEF